MIRVTLNGEGRQVEEGLTVEALVRALGLDPGRVVVERNLEIVPRPRYPQVPVGDGDRLEIVQIVGGG